MKRTLIAAALSTLFVGAVQAQGLSVYGLIDMSYGKTPVDDIAGKKADFHSGGDDGSGQGNSTTRIGFKGTSDLGSGYKGNVKFETGGITSNGQVNPGGNFFNRQAWAGVSGSFGEVRMGRQDSVAFQTMIDFDFNGASNGLSAFQTMIDFDFNGASNGLSAAYNFTGVGAGARGRQSRSLQYISPAMGGVSVQLGFQPQDASNSGSFGTKDAKANFSAAIKYNAGPLSLAAVGESKRTEGGKAFSSYAGSYDLGVAKFMASYADGGAVASGGQGKGYELGVVAPVGGASIGAIYSKNTDSNAKISAYELFVNKEVLKNFILYAEYGSTEDKTTPTTVKGKGYAVGAIYVF